LYFSTNASYELVKNYPFIYYVTERRWLQKYLKFGFKQKNWLGSIFRLERADQQSSLPYELKIIKNYKNKYYRHNPEIFCTNFFKNENFNNNFNQVEYFFNKEVGIKFKSFNSGFSAVCLGYYIAYKLQIPMDIYGMDFGEGGEIHFDGTPMPSRSVVGDRVKRKYAQLYEKFSLSNLVRLTNYSNFDPLDYL
jgi:hypothetical protein